MPMPMSVILNLNLALPESVILLLLMLVLVLLLDGVGLERRGKVRHPLHPLLSDAVADADTSTEAGGVRVQDTNTAIADTAAAAGIDDVDAAVGEQVVSASGGSGRISTSRWRGRSHVSFPLLTCILVSMACVAVVLLAGRGWQ